ncbi:RAQPRD family integrative conjugative element protein [Pseudomonas sp. lyk4-TYG-107]|uniref:integrative conjugative element protein, RAQPRD family n=1 Tax=Pseudomonas sp. lyk4-TYG-107 TaxID=3040317 RepID=UPI0033072E69
MTKRLSKRCLPLFICHFAFAGHCTATAQELSKETIRLATLIRELNAIDRIASLGDTVKDLESQRYHFNYTRLRTDIQRVRTGIEQHLSPQRAAPRDVISLHGNYHDEVVADQ